MILSDLLLQTTTIASNAPTSESASWWSNAIWPVISTLFGAAVGAVATFLGSILVHRREFAREKRIHILENVLPSVRQASESLVATAKQQIDIMSACGAVDPLLTRLAHESQLLPLEDRNVLDRCRDRFSEVDPIVGGGPDILARIAAQVPSIQLFHQSVLDFEAHLLGRLR